MSRVLEVRFLWLLWDRDIIFKKETNGGLITSTLSSNNFEIQIEYEFKIEILQIFEIELKYNFKLIFLSW
jgi:hypothetical protein